MKTTVESPDPLFRQAKRAAVREGKSLKEFFAEAVTKRLPRGARQQTASKPWETAFGGLKALHRENRRIDRFIAAEFGRIENKPR